MSDTTKHYLFDWGDTLMVDISNQTGSMCDWPEVQLVDGAKDCLKELSQHTPCHLATNAQDSSEAQIRRALERVGISDFITHIFCRENLGVDKTASSYYSQIIELLDVTPEMVTMVGDSIERDVLPAQETGLNAFWFNPNDQKHSQDVCVIRRLTDLV